MKPEIIRELEGIVGKEGVLTSPADLLVYQYDAALETALPECVVLPTTTEQVAAVVRLCHREGIPFTPRGAGTNISGGTIPVKGGIVISLTRMDRILEIDIPNQRAIVQPGVINLELSAALAPYGYYFAPDPASQKASTIGGNVGENAGGPHCFKYGVTTNHILGLEVVLPDGQIVWFGGKALDIPGYDLTGLFVGSEGTLGIATSIIVRIMHLPETVRTFLAIYRTLEDAGESVSALIAAGMVPATLEMMDRLTIQAIEDSFQTGYPRDAEAVLIIELDGLKDGLDRLERKIRDICLAHKAVDFKAAATAEERDRLWKGRKGAYGAVARISTSCLIVDGVVPRTKLPEVLRKVVAISQRYGLVVINVFHAGDGNLHPIIAFDATSEEAKRQVMAAGMEILQACVDAGGTISGEHGIGLEKRPAMRLIFSPQDLEAMRRIKRVFDPANLSNPGKLLPNGD